MAIKKENTERVRELEDELSEERITELFNTDKGVARRIVVKRGPRRESVVRVVLLCFALIVAFVALFQYYQLRVSYNNAMKDTIIPKDVIVLSVNAYVHNAIKPGDVVVLDSWIIDPDGGWYEMCSRVIGVPGDMIEIKDGAVYRNGVELDEPYTGDGRTEGTMALHVPDGNYFILGDNRADSIDSRDPRVGFIAEIMIKGKVTHRILPVSRAGRIN